MRDLTKCKNYYTLFPKIGKTVRIIVGDPIDIQDILEKYRRIFAEEGYSRSNV
jgi:rRNA maturation protein Nop10